MRQAGAVESFPSCGPGFPGEALFLGVTAMPPPGVEEALPGPGLDFGDVASC